MKNPDLIGAIADAVVARLKSEGLVIGIKPDSPKAILINIPTAAAMMSRSVNTVRHMVNDGQVPTRIVKRFANRVFFIKEELEKWLAVGQDR